MRLSTKFFSLFFLLAASTACSGPLGPFPGGELSGTENTIPVSDWTFAKDIEVIQLETNPQDPHSVNTWIGVVDNQLYIPTSLILGAEDPSERAWVNNVLADPSVRLRIADVVYAATLEQVDDPALAAGIKQVLLDKYAEEKTVQVANAWVFEVKAR